MVAINVTLWGEQIGEAVSTGIFGNEVILGIVSLLVILIICLRFAMDFPGSFIIVGTFVIVLSDEFTIIDPSLKAVIVIGGFIMLGLGLWGLFAQE